MRYLAFLLALPLMAGDLDKALADVAKNLPPRSKAAFETVAKKNSITVPDVLRSMLEQYAGQLAVEHDPELKKRYEAAQSAAKAAKQAEADLAAEFKTVFPPKPKE